MHNQALNSSDRRSIPLSARRWLLITAGILALAGVLRLRGYDFALPYIDHPDEPNFALSALWWRGELQVFQNPDYPPGYIWLQMAVQTVMDELSAPSISDYVRVMRLFAVAASLGTTLLVALTAWRAGGRLAGLIAGVTWAIAPEIVESGLYATPDPFVYLLVSASTLLAVEAIRRPDRSTWALWSVLIALVATLVKYPAVPAVAAGGLAALYIAIWRDRRFGFRLLALQAVSVALVGVWLVAVYGIANYNEGATAQAQGVQRVTSANLVGNNLAYVFYPLARATWTLPGWGVIAAGLALLIAPRRWRGPRGPHPATVAALWAVMILVPWLATAYRTGSSQAIRDILPGTTAAVVLWAVALAQIAGAIAALLRRRALSPRAGRIAGQSLVLICFLAGFAIPQLVVAWQESALRTYPDTRADLATWAEIALEPGTVVVTGDNHKTFNRYWGGYSGRKWFDSWVADDPTRVRPGEWRQRGMSYLVLPYERVIALQGSAEGRAYLAQLLPLRVIAPQERQRGPAMELFRLWGPDVYQPVEFGGQIRLLGWDVQPAAPRPGDEVALRFYWQPILPPRDNYSVFLHLTPHDDPSQVLAQRDFSPAGEARLPLTWQYPGETLIGPAQTLALPPDLPPGRYVVRLGLYNYVTGERLRVSAPESAPADHTILLTLDAAAP